MQAGRRLAFRDAIELALAAPGTLHNRTAGPSSHASGRRASGGRAGACPRPACRSKLRPSGP
jgi:hypothetical protein